MSFVIGDELREHSLSQIRSDWRLVVRERAQYIVIGTLKYEW